jgi:ABC-2 type transport system permease protein
MKFAREFWYMLRLHLLMHRGFIVVISMVSLGFPLGFVLGMDYLIPNITTDTATYITIGAATQATITLALVGLPQLVAEARHFGRLEYFLSLPISREAYLLAMAAEAMVIAAPGVVFAIILGWWYYDLSLHFEPLVLPAILLGMLAMAGVGMGLAILVPHLQAVNALTQLLIFYFIFFSPVLLPAEQLPEVLQWTAKLLPPGYAADAMRATLTDLPNTNLGRSMLAMAIFSVFSLSFSAYAVRRRA